MDIEQLANEVVTGLDCRDWFVCVAREAAMRAIAAEREACAALADKMANEVDIGPGGDCVQGCGNFGIEIAAAIRARTRERLTVEERNAVLARNAK